MVRSNTTNAVEATAGQNLIDQNPVHRNPDPTLRLLEPVLGRNDGSDTMVPAQTSCRRLCRNWVGVNPVAARKARVKAL